MSIQPGSDVQVNPPGGIHLGFSTVHVLRIVGDIAEVFTGEETLQLPLAWLEGGDVEVGPAPGMPVRHPEDPRRVAPQGIKHAFIPLGSLQFNDKECVVAMGASEGVERVSYPEEEEILLADDPMREHKTRILDHFIGGKDPQQLNARREILSRMAAVLARKSDFNDADEVQLSKIESELKQIEATLQE